jgi:hypothetical protein
MKSLNWLTDTPILARNINKQETPTMQNDQLRQDVRKLPSSKSKKEDPIDIPSQSSRNVPQS